MAANRKAFLDKRGRYDAAAWLDFVAQFNAYITHPRRPFAPITSKDFKL